MQCIKEGRSDALRNFLAWLLSAAKGYAPKIVNPGGVEIWKQTHGSVTHFVAGLGTSGTLMGTGRYLKEQNPAIQVVAIEPPIGERVEGLRNLEDGYIPPVFENWHGYDLLDRKPDGFYAERGRRARRNAETVAEVLSHEHDPLNGGGRA